MGRPRKTPVQVGAKSPPTGVAAKEQNPQPKPSVEKTEARAEPKPQGLIQLESKWMNHQVPKFGLQFVNGRAQVTPEQLLRIKTGYRGWRRMIAPVGELPGGPARLIATKVIRDKGSTTVSAEEVD